jgi:hypothetical protein
MRTECQYDSYFTWYQWDIASFQKFKRKAGKIIIHSSNDQIEIIDAWKKWKIFFESSEWLILKMSLKIDDQLLDKKGLSSNWFIDQNLILTCWKWISPHFDTCHPRWVTLIDLGDTT